MKNHMDGWFYSPAQIKRYLATRITSLQPPGVGRLHWGLVSLIPAPSPGTYIAYRPRLITLFGYCGKSIVTNGSCSASDSSHGFGMLSTCKYIRSYYRLFSNVAIAFLFRRFQWLPLVTVSANVGPRLCLTEIAEEFGVDNAAVSWVSYKSEHIKLFLTIKGNHCIIDATFRWSISFRRMFGSVRMQMAYDGCPPPLRCS